MGTPLHATTDVGAPLLLAQTNTGTRRTTPSSKQQHMAMCYHLTPTTQAMTSTEARGSGGATGSQRRSLLQKTEANGIWGDRHLQETEADN
jgi:hypothetical protein